MPSSFLILLLVSLLLPLILARKNLLPTEFSNGGVWSRMAGKDPFYNSNVILLWFSGMRALVRAHEGRMGREKNKERSLEELCRRRTGAWGPHRPMDGACGRMVAACPPTKAMRPPCGHMD